MEIDGVEEAVGFYTTRFVQADSEAQARQRALGVLGHEERFRQLSRALSSERVEAAEIERVSLWTRRFAPTSGLVFYRQKANAPGDEANAENTDE
jgi:hypothetical protein